MTTPQQGPQPIWTGQQWVVPSQTPGPNATQWWHDGHKWRPPVGAQPTRWQLIAQVPGMMLKLIFLLILLGVCVVFLFSFITA